MNKYWKIILPLLFALAVLFGLAQRNSDPYLGFKSKTVNYQHDSAPDKSLAQYFTEAENYAKTNKPNSLTFLAAGDIVLSRKVALKIKKSADPLLPFSKMKDLLNSVDFSFANLESPANGTENFNAGETLVFNAPKNYLIGLSKFKFKILNLANNHALDQGQKGLEFTAKYLDENNISHVGTGKNLEDAWQPAVIEQNGIKICFIGASYASINDGGKTVNDYVARIEDVENLKLKIKNSKSRCDFVVATMHAGVEYKRNPNQAQIDFAHTAIDAGADLVIGHHPHWIQTTELYKEKYIFYSLGNFIFDQMWSQDTREGLVLKIQLTKTPTPSLQGTPVPAKLDSIELIPVIIDNYSTPRPTTETESKKKKKKIDLKENILK